MKIAVISKADSKGGGASKVAVDLVRGLASSGHDVVHLVSWSSKGYGSDIACAYGKAENIVRNLHAFARRLGAGELAGVDVHTVMGQLERFKPDIVHFHDTSGCFSIPLLSKVSETYRTFWTFHDCSPFTGGCLYDMGCARLDGGCGACPKIGEWPIDGRIDMTARRYEAKHSLLSGGKIISVAPSEWMATHAVTAGRLAQRPLVVSNGVDTKIFSRCEKDVIFTGKEPLRIVLSAGSLADGRKGIRHAVAVVRALAKDIPCEVNLVGNPDSRIESELDGIPFKALGFVDGEEAMARAYGTSDLFLLCSLADNQPLAVLEALSMGMVIGAYASGGIAGMLSDSVNGIIAPPGNPQVLADKLIDAWKSGRFPDLQSAARRTALQSHSMPAFIRNHENMYMDATK
jgi:Glycosyltransferase